MSHYCDASYDERIAAISAETEPAKRIEGYTELAQYIYDNVPSVFIINEPQFNGISERVANHVPHPLNFYLVGYETELK